jgi:hypothetical protein
VGLNRGVEGTRRIQENGNWTSSIISDDNFDYQNPFPCFGPEQLLL